MKRIAILFAPLFAFMAVPASAGFLDNNSGSISNPAPVNGQCMVGAGGVWTAGSCSGAATVNLGASAAATSPLVSGDATTGLYTAGAAKVDIAISGVKGMEVAGSGTTLGVYTDNLTQLTTGNMRFSVTDPAGLMLFKANGVNQMSIGTAGINTLNTISLSPPSILAGAYSLTANTGIFTNGTYTGTSAVGGTYSNFLQTTFNVAGGTQNTTLGVNAYSGAAMTKNIYTMDVSASCGTSPAAAGIECHAARFTSFMNVPFGGSVGSPSGFNIGVKHAAQISGTGSYIGLNMASEVVAANSDPTTNDQCGVCIAAGGTAGTTRNDDGIMFNASYGGAGYFTKYLIDFAGSGLGTTLATTGTAMGSAGTMTITHGIDLHNLTMTGNSFNDGKFSVAGPSGNVATTGTLSTTGTINTAASYLLGGSSFAGIKNTTSQWSGISALLNNNGSNNTAVGRFTLGNGASALGDNNTGVGYHAGFVTVGSNDSFFGQNSGAAVTSGANNTCLGSGSCGTTLTTGAGNIIMGVDATADTAASGTSDTLQIRGRSPGIPVMAATGLNTASPLVTVGGAQIVGGTKFTISGCSATTTLGGASAGSFVSGTTGACTVTITMAGAVGATAPTGWSCWVNDLTTANTLRQSAYTTTTATLTGTTVTSDLITFGCVGF